MKVLTQSPSNESQSVTAKLPTIHYWKTNYSIKEN